MFVKDILTILHLKALPYSIMDPFYLSHLVKYINNSRYTFTHFLPPMLQQQI